MFRRVVLVLTLATLMTVMVVGTGAPALAQAFVPSTPGGPADKPPPEIATPGQSEQAVGTNPEPPNQPQTCTNLDRALKNNPHAAVSAGVSPISGPHCEIDVPAA
jgi:hypothetical protein